MQAALYWTACIYFFWEYLCYDPHLPDWANDGATPNTVLNAIEKCE